MALKIMGGDELVELYIEWLLNSRDEGALALFHEDYHDHDPMPGQGSGVDGIRDVLNLLRDLRRRGVFHLEESLTRGDITAFRVFGAGETQVRDGVGGTVAWTASCVGMFRTLDGAFAERWGSWRLQLP